MTDKLKLPISVMRKQDLIRLIDEFEQLDANLTTYEASSKVQEVGPFEEKHSNTMQQFINENELNIYDHKQRLEVVTWLRQTRRDSLAVHLTFAAEVDQPTLEQMTGWIRSVVGASALIEVGLQPNLIAGVYIRTRNRVFDYSLKARLRQQRNILIDELEALSGAR